MFLIVSSTIGLPLEEFLPILDKNNMVIDWIDFYCSSLKNGWSRKTVLNKIETGVSDYFGNEYKNEVMKRLFFFERRQIMASSIMHQ
jgi:hypothetical protein